MKEIKGKVKKAFQILWENKYRMAYYMLVLCTDRIVIQGIRRFFIPQDFHACIFEPFYQFLISLMINLYIFMVAQHTAYRCQL